MPCQSALSCPQAVSPGPPARAGIPRERRRKSEKTGAPTACRTGQRRGRCPAGSGSRAGSGAGSGRRSPRADGALPPGTHAGVLPGVGDYNAEHGNSGRRRRYRRYLPGSGGRPTPSAAEAQCHPRPPPRQVPAAAARM